MSPTSNSAGPEWILALDDDPWALEIVAGILEPEGHRVHTATTLDEAMAITSSFGAPSLMIVDAMMPATDGFAVSRAWRETEHLQAVPILFLTALMGDDHRVAALEAGADDFLTKPVSPAMLTARVRSILELARLRQGTDRDALGTILDQLGEGVLIVSGGMVAKANGTAVRLLGLPSNPLEPVPVVEFLRTHWRVESGRIGCGYEAVLVPRTNPHSPTTALELSCRVLERESADWAIVVRDVTDRLEGDRAMGRLMRSLGHKLRIPLTGVTTGLDLAKELDDPVEHRAILDIVEESAHRLRSTLLRILEFVEGPAESPAVGRGDPESIAAWVDLPSPAVRSSVRSTVEVDLDLLRRVTVELVANARSAGADTIAIHLRDHPAGGLYVEVTDDGPGLHGMAISRVFEPFYQVDTTGEAPGTGLGLTMLEHLLTAAGGEIGIESPASEHTTVWVRLPHRSSASQ